jgi:hypothetical protein
MYNILSLNSITDIFLIFCTTEMFSHFEERRSANGGNKMVRKIHGPKRNKIIRPVEYYLTISYEIPGHLVL